MRTKKTLLGGAAIAVAIALIGAGVYAAFTDTESTNVAIDSGQLDIVGAADITVTEMAPGDLAFRDLSIDIPGASNDGNLIEFIDVSTSLNGEVLGGSTDVGDPDPGAPWGTDSLWSGADGIQVTFAVCDGGVWTLPAADDPLIPDGADADTLDDSVSCSGTVIQQAEEPVNTFAFTDELDATDFGVPATATGTIPDGSTFEAIAQFRLPTLADNGYENGSIDFDIEFEAIQRAGVNR